MLENLQVTKKIVSDVFEEGIPIFLKDLKLISDDISPLNSHVVHKNKNFVQFIHTTCFGHPIYHIFWFLMEICKIITHLIESIDLICL